jgi:hypothetical protein
MIKQSNQSRTEKRCFYFIVDQPSLISHVEYDFSQQLSFETMLKFSS